MNKADMLLLVSKADALYKHCKGHRAIRKDAKGIDSLHVPDCDCMFKGKRGEPGEEVVYCGLTGNPLNWEYKI